MAYPKKLFRNLFSFSYESEIKLALLFFILFLLLLNFGTTHLLGKTKQILEKEHQIRLCATAKAIEQNLENYPTNRMQSLKRILADLSVKLEVDNILVLKSDGEVTFSSKELNQEDIFGRFWGLDSVKSDVLKKKQAVISDFYVRKGETFIAYYLPLKGRDAVVMVETEAKPLKVIDNAFRLDLLMRLVGLLVVAVSTIFFIKAILKPYRIIKSKARDARILLPSKFEGKDQDIDFVVETFQKVIAELKEKEGKLQRLYQETSQKAKDLRRYTEYILGSMNSGLIICDTQGIISHFNKGAQNILGLSEEETLDRDYCLALGDKSRLSDLIKDALENHKVYLPKEVEMIKPGGEKVWVGVSSSLIRDEDNKLMGVVLSINDLSEIKDLQREVTTKEKMAALGEMAGGLAHQLRNSIAAILGFGKLLKKVAKLDQSNQEIIDGIITESNLTEEMLRKFLSFAKPQSISPEEIDLEDLMEDILKGLEDRIREWKVKVHRRYEKNLDPIWGDRLLLKQCLQNLVQNGIEATHQGGSIHLCIKKEKWDPKKYSQGARFMELKISDNGEGIPHENLERIFNPFFSTKEKGTGLGLSLVRKIVSMHNGRIEVESQINKGSTFKVYLPLELKCPADKSRKSDIAVDVAQL